MNISSNNADKLSSRVKTKSLKVYVEQFTSEQKLWFSIVDYRGQDWMINILLYRIIIYN